MSDDFYPTFTADGEPLESREYMSAFEQWLVAQPDMSRDEQDLVQKSYLAGQASAEQRVKELNMTCEFNEKTMEDLISKLDAFKVVCEKAANSIEYLLERATDSDDCAYGTLATNFVRDCLRDNLTELNGVLGLENYVE